MFIPAYGLTANSEVWNFKWLTWGGACAMKLPLTTRPMSSACRKLKTVSGLHQDQTLWWARFGGEGCFISLCILAKIVARPVWNSHWAHWPIDSILIPWLFPLLSAMILVPWNLPSTSFRRNLSLLTKRNGDTQTPARNFRPAKCYTGNIKTITLVSNRIFDFFFFLTTTRTNI